MRRVTIYFIKIFFFIVIIISHSVYGQNTFQGIILDSITKKPVPYAIVRSFSFGSYTDSLGFFSFKDILDDTAYISCVGYADKKIVINRDRPDTILLSPFFKTLRPVVVGDYDWLKNKKIEIGRLAGPSKFRLNVPESGLTIVKYFSHPNLQKTYVLSELVVRVSLPKLKYNASKFRIRIFAAKDDKTIGEEILNATDIFILNEIRENLAYVDLKKFEFDIPESGCFIGFEFLGTTDESNDVITLSLLGWLSSDFEDVLIMTRNFTKTFRPVSFGKNQKANLYFSVTLHERN
ncbi:MAG: hypothetical protein ACK5VF_02485 [Bacteroidota bacterium]